MRIFLAQQNYHIGNFGANTDKIIAAIHSARQAQGDLIIFPELAVCGYPPKDLLTYPGFLESCTLALARIRAASDGIGVLVGAPAANPEAGGKRLFNAAYLFDDRKTVAVVRKSLLPTYDVFDEYRHFEPERHPEIVVFRGHRLAVTICEDLWNVGDELMYKHSPMESLISGRPELILNLSASPFDYTQHEDRRNMIRQNATRYGLPVLYCNTVGAHTDLIFDGGSLIADREGNIRSELPFFEEALQYADLSASGSLDVSLPAVSGKEREVSNMDGYDPDAGIAHIHSALLTGIRDYFTKNGFQKALVASSGGIDSAVTLALACEALGADQVHALLMPSQYSTDHSVSDAVQLSQNLRSSYDILPIADAFRSFEETLHPLFRGLSFGLAEENLQSRIRGTLAMSYSNKFGHILLNTSNKSELATGYGTLYGDMAGGIGVLGDLYKTQVYALARYMNRRETVIPAHILDKAPSAELRPDQKDSDSLPEYGLLDTILYLHIEKQLSVKEIISAGYAEEVTARVLRMVHQNEYKRAQFCPILRVSPKAFGCGRSMPVTAKYPFGG